MFYDEFVVWIQKTLKSQNLDLYIIFSSFLSEFLSRSVNFEDRVLIFWDNHPETYTNGSIFSDFWISMAKYVFKLLKHNPPADFKKKFTSFFGLRKNTSKIDGKAPLLAQWDATNTSKVDGKAPTFRSALAGRIFWWQIIEQRHKSQRIANYLALPLTIACPHANRL